MQQLQSGTLLQGGKYYIEKVLGQGGFGITYLATQELLERQVCIKEFFYKEYCERDTTTSHVTLGTQTNRELVERFMAKFLKEARIISQLNHPSIIRIYDIFKENNTAYYVMEYIEGESLAEQVNREGVLSESVAVQYVKQVAEALGYIHARNLLHLDIKPGNIMINRFGNAILIDFGLSKQYDFGGDQTSTTPVGISHGYAPMEQYNVGGVSNFSPQTDIYSLGATLYKLVTGNTPPQASEVLNEGLPALPTHLSAGVKNAIEQSMQVRRKDRLEHTDAFVDMLGNSFGSSKSVIHQESNTKKEEETKLIQNEYAKELFRKGMDYYSQSLFQKAIPYFTEAAEQGLASAQHILGLCFYNGAGVIADIKKAVKWYRMSAEQGYALGQMWLGFCYYSGEGVDMNKQEAKEWFEKAAAQGNEYSKNFLENNY